MRNIDRLLRKAKRKIQDRIMVFLPFIISDAVAAEKVSADLDEFCGDRPYCAIIISGEDELVDDAEGVRIDHAGGAT